MPDESPAATMVSKLSNIPPINGTMIVQAILALGVVGVICWLAVHDPATFKDPIVNMGMIALGYWLGSSRSSQAKDEKPTNGGTQ